LILLIQVFNTVIIAEVIVKVSVVTDTSHLPFEKDAAVKYLFYFRCTEANVEELEFLVELKMEEGRSAGFSSGLTIGKRFGLLLRQQEVEEVATPLKEECFRLKAAIREFQDQVEVLETRLRDSTDNTAKLRGEVGRLSAALAAERRSSLRRRRSPTPEPPGDSWFAEDEGFPEWDTVQEGRRRNNNGSSNRSPLKKVVGIVSNVFGQDSRHTPL
jgi:hypothetical protein